MSGFFGGMRDSTHEALGGENAEPLDVQIVQVAGFAELAGRRHRSMSRGVRRNRRRLEN